MKKNFAHSLALIITMLIGAAFTTQVSARTTVDDLIFGSTNKSVIENLSPQVSTTVVINEIYGGGGNTGATFNQDYVELYNLTGADINLANFTLQYASATGATATSFAVCTITAANSPNGTVIPANGFYLIATGPVSTTVGVALTGVNTTCPTSINLSGTAGKIALSSTTTQLNATNCPPTNGTIVDFVGYGSTANCSETAPAPAPANNANSIQRIPNGTDTDNNSADFRVATNTPKAANSAAGNTAPTISDITDKTTPVNTSTGAINFTIGDAETASTSLTVTATSSNQTLVPNANIVLGGTTTARTITITPAANQTGTTTITVTVSDGTTTTSDTFVLTVTPANTAPAFTSATSTTFTVGTAGTFTVTTSGTPAPTITESGALPGGVTFTDNGNGTATLAGTPAAGTAGTYTLTFTATNSAGSTTQTFTLTVNPAAAQAGTIQFSALNYTVGEGGGTATLTVTRTGGADGAVSVDYTLADSSATGGASCAAGVDFINTGGTVSFGDQDAANKTISVVICEDTIFENGENFSATLSNPQGGASIGGSSQATVTINDNDSQPTVSIGNVTQAEGSSGGFTAFDFLVTLSNPTTQTVTVNYSTSDGTAIAPGDYTAVANGTVTIPAGSTTGTATVQVVADTTNEPDETFTVALSNPTNATINVSPGTGTITNDDAAANGTIQFNPTTYPNQAESGSVSLTVTRTGGTDGAVSATYTINSGTATGGTCGTGGADFDNSGSGGTVSFAAGSSTSQTITIPICADAVDETNEQFTVTLSNPQGGAAIGTGGDTATITIIDDDTAGITVTPTTLNLTEGGASATYTVVLNSQPTANVTVTISPDTQLTVAPLTLTFSPANYNVAQTVTVSANNDATAQGNRTVMITQSATSSDTNYNIAAPSVTVNITDDDTPTVTLSQPACSGIAPSPLTAGSTNKALLCFALTSNTTNSFTALSVKFSSDPTVKFTNPRLYRSIDTDYSTTGDNTLVATGTVTMNSFEFTGFSAFDGGEPQIFAPELAVGANNFFVVADVLSTVDNTTPAAQPSVSANDITVTGTTVTGQPATGTNYTFAPAAPTAAAVMVGGRVVNSSGRAMARTRVTLTDSAGVVRTAITNLSGYYRFTDVEVGQTLILAARNKGYMFTQPTQVVSLNEETLNINFTAYPNGDAGR